MNRLRTVLSAIVLTGFAASTAFGQSVISAHSGLIHYVEGRVLLDSQPVEVKIATFPDMKENMELRTEDGRAEILLNPGAFLRVGENSAVRMVSNKLTDSRMELLSGSAVVEADGSAESQGEDIVTIIYKGTATHIRKGGIYHFDSEPAELRVYSGEAEVVAGGNTLVLKSARMVALDSALAVEKFDAKDVDALSRWSRRRAEYISMANVSAAKHVSDSGGAWSRGGWFYNQYFGMITFLPGSGVSQSPYGYQFYSPGAVYHRVYRPPVVLSPSYGAGMGGYVGGGVSNSASSGYSAPSSTATSTYSGSISAAPSGRSAPTAPAAGGGSGAAPVSRR